MLLMDGGDPGGDLNLMLVGHNATAIRDDVKTKQPPPAGKTFTKQQPVQQPNSGRSAMSEFFSQNNRPLPQEQRSKPRKTKKPHVPSYVDDMLFSPSSAKDQDWPAPWEDGPKNKTYVFEGQTPYRPENYSNAPSSRPQSRASVTMKKGSQTERPATGKKSQSKLQINGRPASARSSPQRSSEMSKSALKRPPMLLKHKQSYVDDMLFGPKPAQPDFKAPWESSTHGGKSHQPRAFNFDYSNYKTQKTGTQSRPQSAQKIRHSQTYVDESLFGPKVAEPGWRAPWDDGKDRTRNMNIYDACDYKVTIKHSDVEVVKPKSLVTMQRQRPPSTAKPAWR